MTRVIVGTCIDCKDASRRDPPGALVRGRLRTGQPGRGAFTALAARAAATSRQAPGQRIEHHKVRRPTHWKTLEQPFDLGATLQKHAKVNEVVIVDCLTLWLAQCICPDCDRPENLSWQHERNALLNALTGLPGSVLLVSNEVGMGIVPLGEINRQFQDEQGRLNQSIAQLAGKVSFIAAGLPLTLKG